MCEVIWGWGGERGVSVLCCYTVFLYIVMPFFPAFTWSTIISACGQLIPDCGEGRKINNAKGLEIRQVHFACSV